MNTMTLLFIGVIVAAIVGGLVEYLLDLILRNVLGDRPPTRRHIVFIVVALVTLAMFFAWISDRETVLSKTPPFPPTNTPTVPSATPDNPPETSTPTMTSSVTPDATATFTTTPSATATSQAEATATDTPSPTATATETATARVVPAPQLINPPYGTYSGPITFEWRNVGGVTYQVTLRHVNGQTYLSDWIAGNAWTFNIPAEQYGNWEWFVTARTGVKSQIATFVFDPFPNKSGGNCEIADLNKDGKVDDQDFQIVSDAHNPFTPQPGHVADIVDNQGNIGPDGYVNGADFTFVVANFGCSY